MVADGRRWAQLGAHGKKILFVENDYVECTPVFHEGLQGCNMRYVRRPCCSRKKHVAFISVFTRVCEGVIRAASENLVTPKTPMLRLYQFSRGFARDQSAPLVDFIENLSFGEGKTSGRRKR